MAFPAYPSYRRPARPKLLARHRAAAECGYLAYHFVAVRRKKSPAWDQPKVASLLASAVSAVLVFVPSAFSLVRFVNSFARRFQSFAVLRASRISLSVMSSLLIFGISMRATTAWSFAPAAQ